jgi:hypothetical protein
MNYWVAKGKPAANDFETMLRPGRRGRWHTRKPPKHWEVGDRLFFWKGAPKLETVGIGEIVDIGPRGTRSLDTDLRVRYLSSVLGRPIGIEILRTDATMRSASFLKSGPSGVLFRLSQKQGERLFRLVCQGNPSIRRYWRPRRLKLVGRLGSRPPESAEASTYLKGRLQKCASTNTSETGVHGAHAFSTTDSAVSPVPRISERSTAKSRMVAFTFITRFRSLRSVSDTASIP